MLTSTIHRATRGALLVKVGARRSDTGDDASFAIQLSRQLVTRGRGRAEPAEDLREDFDAARVLLDELGFTVDGERTTAVGDDERNAWLTRNVAILRARAPEGHEELVAIPRVSDHRDLRRSVLAPGCERRPLMGGQVFRLLGCEFQLGSFVSLAVRDLVTNAAT